MTDAKRFRVNFEKKNILDKLQLTSNELSQLTVAWLLFCLAFIPQLYIGSFTNFGTNSNFLIIIQMILIAIAIGFSFIFHELGHKFSAQYFNAKAEFRLDQQGMLVTLLSIAMGFFLLVPGAVFWQSNLSKYSNIRGRVSASGPVVNLILASVSLGLLVFKGAPPGSMAWILYEFGSISFYLNVFIGIFNLIPIWILDGKKILEWSEVVWVSFLIMFFLLIVAFKIAFPNETFNFFFFRI